MKNKAIRVTAKKTHLKSDSARSVRATISFPADRYSTLEEIAKEKRVSLAWVVREAVENYVEAKWPLFAQGR
jgi:hypothetical protein